MLLFDTHTHLLDERFDGDRESVASSLIENGVGNIIEVGTSALDAESVAAFAEAHAFAYAAVGVHPHEASTFAPEQLELFSRLLSREKCVAVGEIGLDYHYDLSPRDVQRSVFREQLSFAQKLNKPVILHIREAFGDALDILREFAPLRGVMHCYSGSLETARECVALGLHIAFGGALCFNNARRAVETAAALPLERLLIETDCPYMAPPPYRGTRNDPTRVAIVADKLAELRNVPRAEIVAATRRNAERLFLG